MKYFLLLLLVLPSLARAENDSSFIYMGTPKMVDGDSFYIGNTEMRLLCIDAVELHQNCKDAIGKEYACGERALDAMTDAVAGKYVTCNGKAQDKYKRPLVFCHTDDTDLNKEMVKRGWAISTCKDTRDLADVAKSEKLGIWAGTFDIPHVWRKANPWHPANDNQK